VEGQAAGLILYKTALRLNDVLEALEAGRPRA
jgi:hypothetical protein